MARFAARNGLSSRKSGTVQRKPNACKYRVGTGKPRTSCTSCKTESTRENRQASGGGCGQLAKSAPITRCQPQPSWAAVVIQGLMLRESTDIARKNFAGPHSGENCNRRHRYRRTPRKEIVCLEDGWLARG